MGKVVVTGAGGFIGSSVARQLVERGREVVAVLEPGANPDNLKGLDLERVEADICDHEAMTGICKGAESLYHLAAIYRLWLPDPEIIYRVNLEGTMSTLLAAQKAEVSKIVYTASIAAVGDRKDGHASDETVPFNMYHYANEYLLTKHLSERMALRFAEAGLPVVVVNPAFPFGARDRGPTPTGKILLTIAKDEAPALPTGGFNAVDVDIVALGHILAEEKGSVGERYILGDHNISYLEFARKVGEVLEKKVVQRPLPKPAALAVSWVYEKIADHITHETPMVTVKGAQYTNRNHFFDVSKARNELGLPSRPLKESIESAVEWYRREGFLN